MPKTKFRLDTLLRLRENHRDELRSRLFEAFVTGRGRQGPRPGTGLGLAIAQGIAQRHRGTLTAASGQSALGGARFVVELPPRQTQG